MTDFPEYDYVIVNDGSTDRTAKVCRKNGYNYIDLPVNLGLSGAFQTGLKYAYRQGYEYALQYDGDGQHKVEYVSKLLAEIKQGYDIVIGSRFVEVKKPKSLRMIGSRVISFAIWLTTGTRIKDPTSGMRMYNRALLKECAMNMNYGPEPDTISYLLKQGVRIKEVQVEMDERMEGTSYLNFTRSMTYMLRMVISILFIQSFRKRDKK
jgi:glycosyltransferase involved in cell wall biosynthesis